MSITYSRQSATEYQVLRDGSHRIGVVAKFGFRWLAISPAHRSLGSFASMSEAGNRLVEEEKMKHEEKTIECACGKTFKTKHSFDNHVDLMSKPWQHAMTAGRVAKSGVVLTIGQRVLVHLDDHGIFHGIVDHFERDGAQAVIMPTRDPVRDVFPKGYNLGSAHWKSQLTLLPEEKND